MRIRRRVTRPRRGMTLIELMVALLLLNVALLALAGLAGTVARQMRGGALQARAAMVVQSRFDSLASVLPCTALAPAGGQRTGSATTYGVSERWVIRSTNNVLAITDTVRFAGRTKPLVYRSMIPCRY